MSNRTKEINRITTTIISISVKLIVYALIVLLLYEAVAKGYAFGHEIFYAEAVERAPGRDVTIEIEREESITQAVGLLAKEGLIKNEAAFIFQGKFYDYEKVYPGTYVLNTSMTSKEILQALNERPEEGGEAHPGNAGVKQKGRGVPESSLSQDAREDSTADENEGAYGDEEQEVEGGWIEEAAEGEGQ